ncbi:MAG: ATP-binding protein [Bacteroidales bacterium]|nr:ATP-binding protein [Bacteroidales bacterium]
MSEYKERIFDRLLKWKLEGMGAVLIEGPKWCGKTTTAAQLCRSALYMNDPKTFQRNMQLADSDPQMLLEGDVPRLIDEWQEAPKLWDTVRYEVDRRGEDGQFVLTGSAVPADMSQVHHTGTGRIVRMAMRTMSLWESGDSTGDVSLLALFSGSARNATTMDKSLQEVAFLVCRGGWPRAVSQKPAQALERAFDYVEAVVTSDISRADGVRRSPDKSRHLMRSYARFQGSQAPMSRIRADIIAGGENSFDEKTLASYLAALRSIFVIEDMPSWNPNLRSKAAIRSVDTRYFTDASIAAAALGVGPKDLLNDLETFGLLFETMAVHDLRVYAQAINGRVYHYRDSDGLECDAVVHLRNGDYGLVEIKLGGDRLVEEGASSLRKLADKLDTTKMKRPSFLMVLTANGSYAFQRPDDVWVVPIGSLRD